MQVTGNQNSAFLIFSASPGRKSSPAKKNLQEKIAAVQETPTIKRDILFNAFSKSRNNVPTLEAVGTVALFRAEDALKFLSLRKDSPQSSIVEDLDKTSRFRDLKINRLNDLKNSLTNLQSRVSRLQQKDALNIRQGKSSKPEVVQVSAGKNSPRTNFSVRVSRLAQENVLVSDEQTAPLGSLGLSGSFFVNGSKVTVEASDSIFDIRNKINFGEDLNNNGILDGPEDLNENNILDTYSVAATEFGPGVFVNEDLNGNGTLDPSEDANNNDRLDGGTTETNVVASVQGNRLVLTSLAGKDTGINLRDDDNVLLSLGFFERDGKGNPVLKERQFDSDKPGVNLIKNSQNAEIEVNGATATSLSNIFQNVVEDTTLTVKQVSQRQAQISLFIDTTEVAAQIKSLFRQFNDSVITLNDILAQSRIFANDKDIQKIRNDLTGPPQAKTRELSQRNRDIDAVRGSTENRKLLGIDIKNTQKNRVQEQSVSGVVQALKSGKTLSLQGGVRNLIQRLSSIGIRTLEDDTFTVDTGKLNRALNINTDEVLDLFNNPENGILTLLDKQLNRILDSGLGDIVLKKQEISLGISSFSGLVPDKLRQLKESIAYTGLVKNLIAVA